MTWNPEQYGKFRSERSAPFEDLFALLETRSGMSVVDLGCGPGELSLRLAERLPASTVVGIDSSAAMLERAEALKRPGLEFELGDAATVDGSWDLVFSHAALHWIDDHQWLIPRLFSMVRPGGQLAVQVPSNHRHPSHTFILEVAGEEPFREALGGWQRLSPVLEIDAYATLLHQSGGCNIVAFEKVYPHLLAGADAVADWTSGTTLVPYFERLPQELLEPFMVRYREKLRSLWPAGSVFYTFRRTIFVATRALQP